MGNDIYIQWKDHPFDETISENTDKYLKFIDDNEAWFYDVHNTKKSILEYLVTENAPFTLLKIKSDYPDAFEALKSVDKSILYASKSEIRDQLLNIFIDDRESLGVKLKAAEDNDNVKEVARLLDAGAPVDVDAYIDRKTNKNIYKHYLDLGYINANHIFDLIDKSTECALELIEACDREKIDIRSLSDSGISPVYKAVRELNVVLTKRLFDKKNAYSSGNIIKLAIQNVAEDKKNASDIYKFLIKQTTKSKILELEKDMDETFLTFAVSKNLTEATLLLLDKLGDKDVPVELSGFVVENDNSILFERMYKKFLKPRYVTDLTIEKERKGMFIKMVDYYAKTEYDHVRILYTNPPIDYVYLTLRLWSDPQLTDFKVKKLVEENYSDEKLSLIWHFLKDQIKQDEKKKFFTPKIKNIEVKILYSCSKTNDVLLERLGNTKPLHKNKALRFKF